MVAQAERAVNISLTLPKKEEMQQFIEERVRRTES
jgi:hypothetical protein